MDAALRVPWEGTSRLGNIVDWQFRGEERVWGVPARVHVPRPDKRVEGPDLTTVTVNQHVHEPDAAQQQGDQDGGGCSSPEA